MHFLFIEQALRSPWLKKEFPTGYFQPCNATVKSIFEGLVKYKDTACDFKRIALMIIAYNSSSDEIKYIRETFKYMNTSDSGAISRDEFRAAFSTFGKTNEELDGIFNVVDINRNGQIDYTEFLAATIETQGTIEEQRLADAFDRLDHDESGYISKSVSFTLVFSCYQCINLSYIFIQIKEFKRHSWYKIYQRTCGTFTGRITCRYRWAYFLPIISFCYFK